MLYNYLFIDSARAGEKIAEARNLNASYSSLYKGNSEESLAAVAPYLFTYGKEEDFESWFINNGWGNSWGFIVQTKLKFDVIYKHFRKFLLIRTEEGEELYFRFYDPRVLKIFLPTCDQKQILEFFGPVKYFIVEGNTKDEAVRFWQENGLLKQLTVSVDEIFG